jgi:hypothetical protein
MARNYTSLTHLQAFDVITVLDQLVEAGKITYDAMSNTCQYDPGLTDKSIADGMPFLCSPISVHRLRQGRYGRRIARGSSPAVGDLLNRVEDLERRVRALEGVLSN